MNLTLWECSRSKLGSLINEVKYNYNFYKRKKLFYQVVRIVGYVFWILSLFGTIVLRGNLLGLVLYYLVIWIIADALVISKVYKEHLWEYEDYKEKLEELNNLIACYLLRKKNG